MNFLPLTTLFFACTFASDSSFTLSSKSSKKPTADKHDFSHIDSVEDIKLQAAAIIKALKESMVQLSEESIRCKNKFDTAASAKSQLSLAEKMAGVTFSSIFHAKVLLVKRCKN